MDPFRTTGRLKSDIYGGKLLLESRNKKNYMNKIKITYIEQKKNIKNIKVNNGETEAAVELREPRSWISRVLGRPTEMS